MNRDEDIRKHPSRPCARLQRPGCLVLFRLTPFGPDGGRHLPRTQVRGTAPQPPLRLLGFLLRVLRERRGGRGSKEAGGGAAAPCLLRSTSPPPADPHGQLNSRNCRGRGRGWGRFVTPRPRRKSSRVDPRLVHSL